VHVHGTGQLLGRRHRLLSQLLLDVPEQIHVRRLDDKKYLNPFPDRLSQAANPRNLHLDQAI
jgi:hypothetical protein